MEMHADVEFQNQDPTMTMTNSISSTPGGAVVCRPLPPGFFPESIREVARGSEVAMQEKPNSSSRAARVAAIIVGMVIALGVGAPWLLNDAPPSPEAVFAAKVAQAQAAPHEAPVVVPLP